MNQTIKIGFLFPYSSVSPHMSQDIIDGFFTSIPEIYRKNFQFYPEYIDKGSHELVKVAVNKLIMFHNVDIISGIVSYKLMPEINSILERQKKLAFFFDLGEYLPPLAPISENIFFNSLQFWQVEYALGLWAQKQFSGKGAILMSIYEAGYQMHSAFWQGALSAGAEEIDMHILPFNPQLPNIEDILSPFFEKIKQSKVDYFHALFCGSEAFEFYKCYCQSDIYNKIPLVVTPYMASDETLDNVPKSNITLYSASTWNYNSMDEKNQRFKSAYQLRTGKKASEFAVMGYEMGQLFLPMLPIFQKKDLKEIIKYIKDASVNGPRGLRNFHHDSTLAPPIINIEKITTLNDKLSRIVLEQGIALKHNDSVFYDIHTQCVSGWKNPYLCV